MHINYIKCDDVKKVTALIAKIFYKDITRKMRLIAVTGTNGKTTITTTLFDYLSYFGYNPLLIGTNGIYFKNMHFHSDNTTPSILKNYDFISECYKKGARHLIMEVSSIGIREARVMYFDFDIVIFTNLNHDHFDYHKNITDYKFSKGLLISDIPFKKNKCVILNYDDETYELYNRIAKAKVYSYGLNDKATIFATNIIKSLNNTSFRVILGDNKYNVNSHLIGGFNVYNILAIMQVLRFLKMDLLEFIDFLKIYVPVSGRMNQIKYNNRIIIIDFAHTPSSVEAVLSSLKEYSRRKLTVIIGAGGNRDTSKRSLIGKITEMYADKIIFTNDNPREEVPMRIIEDITKEMESKNYEIILDRKKAIEYAIDSSIKDEIIAILGKGSERYQIINGIKYPFSDKECIYKYIRSKKKNT